MNEKKDRTPVTFWLNDKKVTGVLAAEIGGKKLSHYNKRYYVVSNETPEKKHFTESSLPASWRNAIAGEAPPSPSSPVAEVQGKASAQVRSVGGRAEADSKRTPAAGPAAKAPGSSGKRQVKGAAAAETEKVKYLCPYCQTSHSCGIDRTGSPFFEKCTRCGKDFGVKVTSRMVYDAEVAAFKKV